MTLTELIETIERLDAEVPHESVIAGTTAMNQCCKCGANIIVGGLTQKAIVYDHIGQDGISRWRCETCNPLVAKSMQDFTAQARTLLPLCGRLLKVYERYRQEPFRQAEAGRSIQKELAAILENK